MPIKKENKHLYPPRREWQSIRQEVLERAENRCEWEGCGLENGALGLRDRTGKWWTYKDFQNGRVPWDVEFEKDGETQRDGQKIVLTIAHKDHDPSNNGTPGHRPNLAAWCQYHHLRWDAKYHQANARRTRDKKKGQEALL